MTTDSKKSSWWEWAEMLVVALALAAIIRFFVMEPYTVDGISMQPNFYTGEVVLVNKFLYRFQPMQDGQVIVLSYPLNTAENFIKRIVATPGQKLQVSNGQVYVNGRIISEPYIKYVGNASYPLGGGTYTVPTGNVFVMGDNRPHSLDSRYFGPVPFKDIKGEVFMILWPLGDLKFL